MLGELDHPERRVHDRKMLLGDDSVGVFKNVLEKLASSDRESGYMMRGS